MWEVVLLTWCEGSKPGPKGAAGHPGRVHGTPPKVPGRATLDGVHGSARWLHIPGTSLVAAPRCPGPRGAASGDDSRAGEVQADADVEGVYDVAVDDSVRGVPSLGGAHGFDAGHREHCRYSSRGQQRGQGARNKAVKESEAFGADTSGSEDTFFR